MITQTATINLIPSNVPTVIHVSQYDVGRVISLTILNGVTQFIFGSGQTAIVNGRKPDKTVFTYDASISNNIVSFTTTQQMLAVAGKVLTEIRIQDGNRNDIGTANFILDVENAPIDENAIYSESDIPAIEQAVANIGQAKAAVSQAQAAYSATIALTQELDERLGLLEHITQELDERLGLLEHMVIQNDIACPITDDDGALLVFDDDSALLAEMSYKVA